MAASPTPDECAPAPRESADLLGIVNKALDYGGPQEAIEDLSRTRSKPLRIVETTVREAEPPSFSADAACPTCGGSLGPRPVPSRWWSAWAETGRIGIEPSKEVCFECGAREATTPDSVFVESVLREVINSRGGTS